MDEPIKPKDAMELAAIRLEEEWDIGESSRFCDDAPEWRSAKTEEIADVIRKAFKEFDAKYKEATGPLDEGKATA